MEREVVEGRSSSGEFASSCSRRRCRWTMVRSCRSCRCSTPTATEVWMGAADGAVDARRPPQMMREAVSALHAAFTLATRPGGAAVAVPPPLMSAACAVHLRH